MASKSSSVAEPSGNGSSQDDKTGMMLKLGGKVADGIRRFIDSCRVRPTATAAVSLLLEEALKREGCWDDK